MAGKEKVYICITGGNLSDGTRFEAGDELLASSLKKEDLAALLEMGAIEVKNG